MNKFFIVSIGASLAIASSASAQAQAQAQICDNAQTKLEIFLSPEDISDIESVLTGEVLKSAQGNESFGQHLPPEISWEYRRLDGKIDQKLGAVYAVTFDNKATKENWYWYFVEEKNECKISAIRKLALPGLIYAMRDQLTKSPNLTPIDEQTLKNLNLITRPDHELKDHLISNIDAFNKLVENAKTDIAQAQSIAKSMNLNYIDLDIETGNVDVNIGGITDNSVGYFKAPHPSSVPAMSPDSYIYVEHIIDDWYIYKTT
ncbi:hypothetical protein [Kordiimonas sp. SCSIO 12610]|uniref:hypothetical protein n=1 Tax=Kordiimonas sp. SCSIO 12610 TaxID=2829597 RepID=UPI0021087F79|nr:hypothetical protein [Kordiimonas sp. SCSIO 12610]UTW56124.1 hypothetical protein KFF44_04305 [Kordiimonas sp. SCSIO 12610]